MIDICLVGERFVMRLKHGIFGRAALGALAAAVVLGAGVTPAMAGLNVPATMNITVTQVGSDVVAQFSGDINTSTLSEFSSAYQVPVINATGLSFFIGGSIVSPGAGITGYVVSLPSFDSVFASNGLSYATSATGSVFGFLGGIGIVFVPTGYLPDAQIAGSSTFAGETIAGIGLNVGTYSQTYGTGNTINLTIGTPTPVPEPASMALLAAGVAGIGAVRRRKRA